MTGRNNMPGDSTLKPGPGSHHPEKVNMILNSNTTASYS
jgi:hypothetical protein